jgi:uncharacterized membrane protein
MRTKPAKLPSETGGVSLPSDFQTKQETGTGNDGQSATFDLFARDLNETKRELDSLEKSVDSLKTETENMSKTINKLNEQSNRNIEVIGIFSSVIALLIMNVTIITKADNLLNVMILIIATACIVIIFASLMHYFFNPTANKLSRIFWISMAVLAALLIATCLYSENVNNNLLNNLPKETRADETKADASAAVGSGL